MSIRQPPWGMRPLAAERYKRLGAQTDRDSDGGFLLAALVDAKASMWDELEHVAREDDAGRPGWIVAADPATCRPEFLPWAAQFYGETVHPQDVGPSVPPAVVAAIRARVARRPRLERGTTAAIVEAMKAMMVGAKRVVVRDRYNPADPTTDSAYHLQVRPRSSDIHPDFTPEDLFAAGRAVKPAWVVLHTGLADERDYDDVPPIYPTYGALLTGNTNYADILTP
ncbi:unannotated protein [freshwater metagenome]|uniref:Unannotated protein n=1 Tax=freshwater metagenome TaxID=449393 RepID=A0A6J7FLP5_9ZZZZ|nr:hypothetical protein [Actinomycetota bacterium]